MENTIYDNSSGRLLGEHTKGSDMPRSKKVGPILFNAEFLKPIQPVPLINHL